MTIWNITPFFLALVDKIIWKASIVPSNVLGMIFMVVCGCAISISKVFEPELISYEKDPTLGVYVPVLVGVATALCLVLCIVGMKYGTIEVGTDAQDFNFGFYFVQGVILQILALIHFTT